MLDLRDLPDIERLELYGITIQLLGINLAIMLAIPRLPNGRADPSINVGRGESGKKGERERNECDPYTTLRILGIKLI